MSPQGRAMQCILKVIYNIPICGGFCAPTANEEPCFRHVSNEYTVPLSLRFMFLSPVIEHNPCCIGCGKIGVGWGDRRRKPLLLFAFSLNVIAFVMTILAAIGTSRNADQLQAIPWVVGEGTLSECTLGRCTYKVYVGTEMRVDEVDCSGAGRPALCAAVARSRGFAPASGEALLLRRSTPWDDADACSLGNRTAVTQSCEDCRKAVVPKRSLILSLLTQFPTITTDLQRLTRFGDVNCQKGMGVFTNLLSFCTSIVALMAFRNKCWNNLPTSSDFGDIAWHLAPGFRLLMGATIIKIADGLIHFTIRTPRARWTKPTGPERHDLAKYMQLGVAPDAARGDETAPGQIELGVKKQVEPVVVGAQ